MVSGSSGGGGSSGGSMVSGMGFVGGVRFLGSSSGGGMVNFFLSMVSRSSLVSGGSFTSEGGGSDVNARNVEGIQVNVQSNRLIITAANGSLIAISSNERNENEHTLSSDGLVTVVRDGDVARGTVGGGAVEVDSRKVV